MTIQSLSKSNQHIGVIVLFFYLVLILGIEFSLITFPGIMFITNYLLFIFTLYLMQVSIKQRIFLKKVGLLILGTTVVSLFFHFVVNSINIYQWVLPAWFYQLKLFRLVTLTGGFFVQLFLVGAVLSGVFLDYSKYIKKANKLQLLVAGFIIATIATHLHLGFTKLYQDSHSAILNRNVPFAARVEQKLGGAHYYGWVWPYTQFITERTPTDAVIAIPEKSVVWKMEGNEAYIRYFLYPRQAVHIENGITDDVTHIMIALGECGEGACGFPKFTIPAEQIQQMWLIDRATQEVTSYTGDYEFDTDVFKWGIIELKDSE